MGKCESLRRRSLFAEDDHGQRRCEKAHPPRAECRKTRVLHRDDAGALQVASECADELGLVISSARELLADRQLEYPTHDCCCRPQILTDRREELIIENWRFESE